MSNDFKTLPILRISASQVRDEVMPHAGTDPDSPTPYLSAPFLPFVRFNVYDTADGGKEIRCEQYRTLEDYIGEEKCTSKVDLIRIVHEIFTHSYAPKVAFPSRNKLSNLLVRVPFAEAKETLRKMCHSRVSACAKDYLRGIADKYNYMIVYKPSIWKTN